jgi:hypothetical protein
MNCFPRVASNSDPPDLIPSSWDYRHEPLAPSPFLYFNQLESLLYRCRIVHLSWVKELKLKRGIVTCLMSQINLVNVRSQTQTVKL